MKKAIYIGILGVLALSLIVYATGCKSREDMLSEELCYEDKQKEAMSEEVIKCINNKDEEGLKGLFSESAKEDIADFDDKIGELIDAFNGNKITGAKYRAGGSSGAKYAQPLNIMGKYTYTLSNDEQYDVVIDFCDIDDENKENVGLTLIEISTCSHDDLPDDFFLEGYDGEDDDGLGIYIHYIDPAS